MKLAVYLSIYSILIIQGCTTQQAQIPHQTPKVLTTENNDADEMENDFENEFQDENNVPTDPLSGYNRVMTSFNDMMLTYALNPVSEMYGYMIPQPIRIGISNVFKNLQFPVRFTNNLLQGKVKNATQEYGRFVFNSTLGLGGFIDVATTQLHIPEHQEDFGQTLGYYGIGSGFPIVLPFLGPSNLRDMTGLVIDSYASPSIYTSALSKYKIPHNTIQSTAILAGQIVNENSLHTGEYENLKKDALDLYPFLRDIYEQKRNNKIKE